MLRRTFIHLGALAMLACTACQKAAPSRDQARARADRAPSATTSEASETATLVLHHGKIYTVDPQRPQVEAVAVSGDKILAVGSNAEIKEFIGKETEVIDLQGRFAMPGFIESHAHFVSVGQSKLQLDLNGVKSWDEVVAMVKAAAQEAEPGEWILGRGWHQERWEKPPEPNFEGLPLHTSLSAVSPHNPVSLKHSSGHAVFANAKAMELAKIDNKTKDPEGGTIVRDNKGHAIGVFRENAEAMVSPTEGNYGESGIRKRAKLAAYEALSHGITSFQDAGSSLEEISIFHKMAKEDALGVRLWVMLREDNATIAPKLAEVKYDDVQHHRLKVTGIKRYIDGALGSHGAWLLAPYTDMPETSGLNVLSIEELTKSAQLAKEHGFQLCVHAIGDRGNREILDVFEKVLGPQAKSLNHRWRVEHAQHLSPEEVPRFAKLGVIASIQGVQVRSDGDWVPDRIGDDRTKEGAYVWKLLLDSGAVVINGTDAPVERINPLDSFYVSVTRKLSNGKPFYPEYKMSREQALKSYTLDAAYGTFEEAIKGSLMPGKLADITVLSKNIMTVPAEEILSAQVVYTIVGGKIRYRGDRPAPN